MSQPIPMRLTCPECGQLHVDKGEFATKPHHTHACQSCGHVWRPAVVCTVGVRFLPGFKDSPGSAGSVTGNLAEATPADVPSAPSVGRLDVSGESDSPERARLRALLERNTREAQGAEVAGWSWARKEPIREQRGELVRAWTDLDALEVRAREVGQAALAAVKAGADRVALVDAGDDAEPL